MSINLWRVLLTVISMSLSGSILFILYLIIRKLFKKRLSARIYYVILVLVILRMIVPLSPDFSTMNTLYSRLTAPVLTESSMNSSSDGSIFSSFLEAADEKKADHEIHGNSNVKEKKNTRSVPFWKEIILTVWLSMSVGIFVINTLGYLFRSNYIISRTDHCVLHKQLLIEMMGKKRRLDVLLSNQVNTPMLIGIIDPVIILPCVVKLLYDYCKTDYTNVYEGDAN